MPPAGKRGRGSCSRKIFNGGQAFIKLYYQLSPILLKGMAGNNAFKKEVREILDLIVPVIREELE